MTFQEMPQKRVIMVVSFSLYVLSLVMFLFFQFPVYQEQQLSPQFYMLVLSHLKYMTSFNLYLPSSNRASLKLILIRILI